MKVPDSDFASQAARGQDLIGRGVEGDAPGGARMPPQDVQAFPRGYIRHPHSVVSMGWGHPGSEKGNPNIQLTNTMVHNCRKYSFTLLLSL